MQNFMKFLKILSALALLLITNSCIFLSKSAIINADPDEAISIVGVRIINDGKLQTSNTGPFSFCQVRFVDEQFEDIKFRNGGSIRFYILKSNPGKVTLDTMTCMDHKIPLIYLKHRHVRFADYEDMIFKAQSGVINYAGDIEIDYTPWGFRMIDLLALGGNKFDTKGTIKIKVEDRMEEARAYLLEYYPELLQKYQLVKSAIGDLTKKPASSTPAAPAAPAAAPAASNSAPTVAPTPTNSPPTQNYYSPGYYSSQPAPQHTPNHNQYYAPSPYYSPDQYYNNQYYAPKIPATP